MPLISGQVLNNRYRIVKLLGQGGCGAVYKAWDINLNGAVAVKENFDTLPAAQGQFAREASILFNLRHPNLPRVIDHFNLPGQGQYLVMDYIEGEDLEELCVRGGGRLDESQVLPWIGQVLDALTYMHAQQPPVIHRDIKPANIKITKSNDPTQPSEKAILVDFGVAKIYDPSQRTLTGARAVTPGYAPFEQYGKALTDGRSDIYALGATLYTLLTGEQPEESISRMAGAVLRNPRDLNPAISPLTEQVILKAMAVMPDQRYRSALEFKTALLSHSKQPSGLNLVTQTIPATPAYQSSLSPTLQSNLPSAQTPGEPSTPSGHPLKSDHRLIWVLVGFFLFLVVTAGLIGNWYISHINSAIIATENAIAAQIKPTNTLLPYTLTPLLPTSSATLAETITPTLTLTLIPSSTLSNTPTSSSTPSRTPSIRDVLPWQTRTFNRSPDYFQFQVTFTAGEQYIIWIDERGECSQRNLHTYLYDHNFNILADTGGVQLRYMASLTGTYYIRVYNRTDPIKFGSCTLFRICVSTAL